MLVKHDVLTLVSETQLLSGQPSYWASSCCIDIEQCCITVETIIVCVVFCPNQKGSRFSDIILLSKLSGKSNTSFGQEPSPAMTS